jgi:hypothetical protein
VTTSAPIDALKNIVLSRFPWLAYVSVATDGGLSLRAAAAKLLHLQGEAGDPGAAFAGSFVVRLALDAGVPSFSTSTAPPYAWLPIPAGSGPGGALLPTDAGVAISVTVGSSTVTVRP